MISETGRQRGLRYAELAFLAAVTALLLALVAEGTGGGLGGLAGVLVYAVGAGFGLEFVAASWCGRPRPRDGAYH